MAKEAYRSYILAYNSHSSKDIFSVQRLDMQVQLLEYIIFYNYFMNMHVNEIYSLNRSYAVKHLFLYLIV